jgi:hypothetical protein
VGDGIFDGRCPRPGRVADVQTALQQRDHVRKVVAGFATDADDLRYLLDALALWPSDDEEAFSVRNKSLLPLARLDRGPR